MIPTAWVPLESLPLTPTGKVDRRSLPVPGDTGLGTAPSYVAPRTPTEEIVAAIWAELLNRDRVGVHQDFFELGGHSLLATRVISRLHATLGVTVPVRTLFDAPTVAGTARIVDRLREDEDALALGARDRLAVTSDEKSRELSFAQERLWFLDQFDPGPSLAQPAVYGETKG